MSRWFEIVRDDCRKNPNSEIKLPTRSTKNARGYDFFSPCAFTLMPGESTMIWTDVKANMGMDEFLMLDVRSSMGKYPVVLANTIGIIDSDYFENPDNDGNIGLRLINNSKDTPYSAHDGDKIAQGIFMKYLKTMDDETDTERIGGFGSTGE